MSRVSSTRPGRRGRLSSWFSGVHRIWDAVQAELHGDYPIDHIKAFHAYAERTPWWRALLICFATPVPAVLFVLLSEIVTLEDPETHDARSSPNVWIRFLLMTTTGSMCVLEQFRQHVPSLELSRRAMVTIAIPSSIATTFGGYLIAVNIAYPMPFTPNIAMTPWIVILVGLLLFTVRQQLREKPQLLVDLKRHQFVCVCQFALAVVYPLYNTAFVRLSAWKQTASVFILPCIKVAAKNVISRWLANTDEARSEGVIFNVEVFHALFVSFSMQGSSSAHTIVALMIIDAVHVWFSFRDIHTILRRLQPMLPHKPEFLSSTNIVSLANGIAEHEPFHGHPVDPNNPHRQGESFTALLKVVCCRLCKRKVGDSSVRSASASSSFASGSMKKRKVRDRSAIESGSLFGPSLRSLAGGPLPPELQALSSKDRGILVRRAQKLFFVTEFIALVEYTEVIIPCLFNMYLVIMFNLPNRQFYDFLMHLSTEALVSQITAISIYALLELVSLVIIAIILWRQLGLSLLHQIAFVLDTRQASIQSKVIMWSILVMQYGVRQFGVDYTFQFAWLQKPPSRI